MASGPWIGILQTSAVEQRLNWFGRTAPTGGMRGSPCRSFLQIREFLAVSIHEPVGQQRHVFALYSRRQGKETHRGHPSASTCATVAGPRGAATVVDHVVDRDLFALADSATGNDLRSIVDESFPCVGIATVVVVAVGDAVQDDLALGVMPVAVLDVFVSAGSQWGVSGDLTDDVDHPDGFPDSETSAGEDSRSLDIRVPNLHIHDRTVVLDAPRWPELVWPQRLTSGPYGSDAVAVQSMGTVKGFSVDSRCCRGAYHQYQTSIVAYRNDSHYSILYGTALLISGDSHRFSWGRPTAPGFR